MGDFRADIDLKMTMFGKTYKRNMWINYWDNGDGVDDRIIEFFRESWNDARTRHDAIIYKSQAKERKAAERKFELAELKRLKAKYKAEDSTVGESSRANDV